MVPVSGQGFPRKVCDSFIGHGKSCFAVVFFCSSLCMQIYQWLLGAAF